MQKRIVVTACCALFFCVGLAIGQHPLDASNWSDLGKTDELARIMYLKGYTEGYRDGSSTMGMIAAARTKKIPPDSSTNQFLALASLRLEEVAGLGKTQGITIRTIETTMSSFYIDYRNAPVCWSQALQFSIWSMSGDAATDQELDAARKSGAETGCN
jgi:hypothetical protein